MTDDHRAEVRRLAGEGVAQPAIAEALGITAPTLRKYFAAELADRLGSDNLFTAASSEPPSPEPAPLPSRPRPPRRVGGGRKSLKFGEAERTRVSLLVAAGTKHGDIARVLGITEPTLRRHFADELATGAVRKRAEVLEQLHRSARGGNVTAQRALLDMFDKAQLESIEDEIRQGRHGRPDEVKVGKKIQAVRDAVEVVTQDDEWRELLQ